MDTSIVEFNQQFCIPAIHKFALHLAHVNIIGTNNCGNSRQESFQEHAAFRDVLCCQFYS